MFSVSLKKKKNKKTKLFDAEMPLHKRKIVVYIISYNTGMISVIQDFRK